MTKKPDPHRSRPLPLRIPRQYPAHTNEAEILRELRYLAGYATDSSNPNSMGTKDLNASRALRLAGELLSPLVGWAIDHETGKATKKRKSAVPTIGHDASKEELDRQLAANSHDNERIGARYDGKQSTTNRRVAAHFLRMLSEGMNWEAGQHVAGALGSLDFGVVYDELKPIKSGRKQSAIRADNAKLKALAHIEYRRGKGETLEAARSHVSEAYRVSDETLKKWHDESESRLLSVDQYVFKRYLSEARTLGKLMRAISSDTGKEVLPPEIDVFRPHFPANKLKIEMRSQHFSEDRLRKDGGNYTSLESGRRQRK